MFKKKSENVINRKNNNEIKLNLKKCNFKIINNDMHTCTFIYKKKTTIVLVQKENYLTLSLALPLSPFFLFLSLSQTQGLVNSANVKIAMLVSLCKALIKIWMLWNIWNMYFLLLIFF